MHHRFLVVSIFGMVAWTQPGAAQDLVPRSFPLRFVESWSLKSPSMGNSYDIVVGLPPGYAANPDKRWPAIFTTDGNLTFYPLFDAAKGLGEQGDIEQPIVISIGSPFEEGDPAWVNRRVYEFSPPNWSRQDAFGKLITGLCGQAKTPAEKCTGGAPRFLDFIVKEVIPLVSAKYRVDTSQLGLFGVSAGGFFAAWTIFQPNSPFTRYIISSPAMAYGDGEIYRLEEQYAASHKDLKIGIYMSSGGLEMDHPMFEHIGQIVSGQMRLGGALKSRNYPGLKMLLEMHPNMSHSDVASTTMNRGMRVLYGK